MAEDPNTPMNNQAANNSTDMDEATEGVDQMNLEDHGVIYIIKCR